MHKERTPILHSYATLTSPAPMTFSSFVSGIMTDEVLNNKEKRRGNGERALREGNQDVQ